VDAPRSRIIFNLPSPSIIFLNNPSSSIISALRLVLMRAIMESYVEYFAQKSKWEWYLVYITSTYKYVFACLSDGHIILLAFLNFQPLLSPPFHSPLLFHYHTQFLALWQRLNAEVIPSAWVDAILASLLCGPSKLHMHVDVCRHGRTVDLCICLMCES